MIQFTQHTLSNGLRVLIHEDKSTPMAGVSLLYDVGSRDEHPERTGYAHLFEHLMFSGSKNIPEFDEPLQMAGGENNAYTTNDCTVYHEILPATNLETALWLESDRMHALRIRQRNLSVQRKVVVEEFKETCLEEPYGDLWHHLSPMAYPGHPYEWPTIGAKPEHISSAQLADVKAFYYQYYAPNNAILAICGPIPEQEVLKLVKKWFEEIPPSANLAPRPKRSVPPLKAAQKVITADVPLPAFFLAYPCPIRIEPDFYVADLITDVLADGPSSRFIQKLVKEQALFTQIDAYLSDTVEGGLILIEGHPAPGVPMEKAMTAIRTELELLKNQPLTEYELLKVLHRHENAMVYSEGSVLSKAQNLCYYAWLGDPNLINTEIELCTAITAEQIQRFSQKTFTSDQEILITYVPSKVEKEAESAAV